MSVDKKEHEIRKGVYKRILQAFKATLEDHLKVRLKGLEYEPDLEVYLKLEKGPKRVKGFVPEKKTEDQWLTYENDNLVPLENIHGRPIEEFYDHPIIVEPLSTPLEDLVEIPIEETYERYLHWGIDYLEESLNKARDALEKIKNHEETQGLEAITRLCDEGLGSLFEESQKTYERIHKAMPELVHIFSRALAKEAYFSAKRQSIRIFVHYCEINIKLARLWKETGAKNLLALFEESPEKIMEILKTMPPAYAERRPLIMKEIVGQFGAIITSLEMNELEEEKGWKSRTNEVVEESIDKLRKKKEDFSPDHKIVKDIDDWIETLESMKEKL